MIREDAQRGSTLIMVIGVIAALAIMATSLVALVMNVNANTGHQRMQVKALDVAEAGLDNGLYVLGSDWPRYETSTPPAIDTSQFLSQFPDAEFPRPSGGAQFIDVSFYDNGSVPADTSVHWDQNGDKKMWVDATAMVGSKAVRVRALAEEQDANLNLPRGIVLFAGGGLWMHGGGTPVGVVAGGLPPGTTQVTAWYGNDLLRQSGSADFSSQVKVQATVNDVPSANDIISTDVLTYLKTWAIQTHRYYTNVSAAEAALSTGPLVYLKTNGDVTITANGIYNGDGFSYPSTTDPKPPGILIVDGGGITFHGTPTFYGLVYCTQGFIDVGNATIIGMVVSADEVSELGGSDQVMYDDRVIMQLNNSITVSAQIVPGTWRQLKPQ